MYHIKMISKEKCGDEPHLLETHSLFTLIAAMSVYSRRVYVNCM